MLTARGLTGCGPVTTAATSSAKTRRATLHPRTRSSSSASGTARSRWASFTGRRQASRPASPRAGSQPPSTAGRPLHAGQARSRSTFAPVPEAAGRAVREQHVAAGAPRRRDEARLGQRGHRLAGEREGARGREQGRREDRRRRSLDHRGGLGHSRPGRPLDRADAGMGPQEGGSRRQRPGLRRLPAAYDRHPRIRLRRHGQQDGRRALLPRADAGAHVAGGPADRARGDARRVPHEAQLRRARRSAAPRAAALDAGGLQQGSPVGDDHRPQRVHGLQRLRHRVHGREQRPGRRQAGGLARPRDALAAHRPLLRRARRDRRDGGRAGGHQRAARVRAVRGSALRERLPGQRHDARPRGAERDGVQPLHRHAVLRQQLPVQGPQVQLPQLAQRLGRSRRPAACPRRCRCSRTRTSRCASAA